MGYGSPALNPLIVEGVEPEFSLSAANGMWTHFVSAANGGFVGIGKEQDSSGTFDNGGVRDGVTQIRPPDGGSQTYRMVAYPFIGYEFVTWDGNFQWIPGHPMAVVTAIAPNAINGQAEFGEMPTLTVEVVVDGGSSYSPAEAGYVTATDAKKYYPLQNPELVKLQAAAHAGFVFTKWSGQGVAYSGNDAPNLQYPMQLDRPGGVEVTPVWVAVESGTTVTAHFIEDICPEGEHTSLVPENLEEWGANYMSFVVRIKPFDFIFDGYQASEITPENYRNEERDTCYFSESDYDPWVAVTGSTFDIVPMLHPEYPSISISNFYFDDIGWAANKIGYYRANRPMPCQTTLKQYIYIHKSGCEEPFAVNDIVVKIDTKNLFVSRGVPAEWEWPIAP